DDARVAEGSTRIEQENSTGVCRKIHVRRNRRLRDIARPLDGSLRSHDDFSDAHFHTASRRSRRLCAPCLPCASNYKSCDEFFVFLSTGFAWIPDAGASRAAEIQAAPRFSGHCCIAETMGE